MQRYRSQKTLNALAEKPAKGLPRYRSKKPQSASPRVEEPLTATTPKRPKREAGHLYFTDTSLSGLKPKPKQFLRWDAWTEKRTRGPDPARGLAVLVSPKGAKSFRAAYYFAGSPKVHYIHIGRVGEVTLDHARKRTFEVRGLAKQGIDPAVTDASRSDSFETAWSEYIEKEQRGRRGNTSSDDTDKLVRKNTMDQWASRAVATLTYREIDNRLASIRDGDPAKSIKPKPSAAIRTFAHLRDFFKWCAVRGTIKTSPMENMPAPATGKSRERRWSDDEIRNIWSACDKLGDVVTGTYVKLILLKALRREEMGQAEWTEFDNADEPTLFTVPTERIKLKASSKLKKRRVYLVPLVPLAQNLLKAMRGKDERYVFPRLDPEGIKAMLVPLGAPQDFRLHDARHTITSWLEDRGRSEWERGLILNHSSTSVTAGYSHGYPLDLKRTMLSEWADYVERLVVPGQNVKLLR